jgi:hypothetical protein
MTFVISVCPYRLMGLEAAPRIEAAALCPKAAHV